MPICNFGNISSEVILPAVRIFLLGMDWLYLYKLTCVIELYVQFNVNMYIYLYINMCVICLLINL